jgi:serine/threonine protein kinase
VHRDLKPDNILLDTDQNVKIADFGLSKRLLHSTDGESGTNSPDSQPTTGESVPKREKVEGPVGTPLYMSPEQMHGATETTPASDVFSLGVVCVEMSSLFHSKMERQKVFHTEQLMYSIVYSVSIEDRTVVLSSMYV